MSNKLNDCCTRTRSVDVDIHRFKCPQCGTIGYYSGAARAFYERGVTCSVYGLTKEDLYKRSKEIIRNGKSDV